MKPIDISKWKSYKVSDIFETIKKGKQLQVPTGANIPTKELSEDGTTPRITVTGFNNGIYGYFDYNGTKPSDYRVFNNFISVSFLGTVFYQPNDASLDMKVHCLKPISVCLNKYTGQYLVSAIKASLRESSYSDQISSTVLPKVEILLPATDSGKPDWKLMEDKMKQVEQIAKSNIDVLLVANKNKRETFNTNTWGEFCLSDLFNIVKGTRLTKADMIDGDINYVGASSFNNGITYHIGNDEHVHPAGTLTVTYNGSDIGRTFYQDEPYWATDDVNVFYPKFSMTKEIALFLAPVIKAVGGNHVYKDKWQIEDMKKDTILLPTNKQGKPDWNYIDEYMKKISEKVKEAIKELI